jgi:integrase
VLTENEYQNVRRVVIESSSLSDELKLRRLSLLTLLRRCGLRSSEASWLTVDNFLGLTEHRLHVLRSKTRAGRRRMLPLYLLLADDEMGQLCRFIQMRREQGGTHAFLFTDDKGERTQSANIGREIELLLRTGGVRGETAHGLRHALASALFAAWWLKCTSEDRAANPQAEHSEVGESWARRALRLQCRPGIDAQAVSHAYHIQLLLGHADLLVTFDRYIHLVDLALADAVWMFEHGQCEDKRERMKLSAAARLAGMDIKQLRFGIPENKRANSEVTLMKLNDVLSGRLLRLLEKDK